jgi:HK97 family phage prohead protease
MPYYITDKSEQCSEWAVIKEDGEVLACHDTKESAIDQAIAVSLAEDTEFGGERAAVGLLVSGDWVSWEPNDSKILAQVVVVEDQYAVVRVFEYEYGVFSPTDKLMVINVFSIEKIQRPERIAVEEEELPEPENDMDDDMMPREQFMSRALPDELEVGGFVSWRASGGRARGRVVRINRNGDLTAPESDFTITGTPDDPAALIRIYEQTADGWSDTPVLVVHRFTTLTKIDDLVDESDRARGRASRIIARIDTKERTMTDTTEKTSRWADVARAIQKKIDGEPTTKDPEIRTTSTEFELRAEEGDGMTFTGYASVFNSSSEDLGGFREFVAPGAFKRSLQARNEIKLLWNHDTNEPLASVRGGSLQLMEDNYGLKVTAKLPNTTRGRDVAELLRSKVIDSMSFGFNVIKDSWSNNGSVRTLESVRLSEVSVVTFPAYQATTAQVRSVAPSIDADELANALLKLESGEDLDEKSASLITDVVGKLRQQPEPTVETDDNGLALLDLKKKQLDLLLKRI